MPLPTREEINVYNSLDEQCACEHFLGRNLEQAEALFRDAPLYYQEDLMWMGPVAFRYYVSAIIHYIQSEAAANNSDIINFFLSILEFRLEYESKELAPVAEQLAAICGYVIEYFASFDLALKIDGDIRLRFQVLQKTFLAMAKSDMA